MQKLITQDKVSAVIAPIASSSVIAGAQVNMDNKVLAISPTASNPKVTVDPNTGKVRDYLFRAAFIDPFQGSVMANFATKTLNGNKAALYIDNSSDYVKGLGQFFKETFIKNGGTIVAEEAYLAKDTDFKATLTKLKAANPDVVFIIIHGGIGEDGTIQKILEKNKIKFIGSGSKASALGIDKSKFKKLMINSSLPVPKGIEINKNKKTDLEKIKKLGNKWVVKPVSQGSSVGVSLVDDFSKINEAMELAFKFDDRILIEEFVSGIEVSCGLLGNENPVALPVIEICPKNIFFDYEAKYKFGKCEEIVPARLSKEITKKIQNYSLKVFKLINCRGMARVDFIINENKPVILEINTIPGMTPNSLLPKEAKSIGINYSQLLDKIIELALK
ncbi:D-alanine--D-alanine ligase [bioreactor metagenome]|uniref:D-alanine--D-alanine ligase n=1 Tax=bioreactor metagenome TaxID=1076179 RepID=A0A645CKK3_9ZZZZ